MKSIYALIAVGLDAARIAFSKSKIEKKAVSAVAAAVVGIGLFLAPMEKAQAQSGIPKISGLCIVTESADFSLESGWFAKQPLWDVQSLLAAPLGWQYATAKPDQSVHPRNADTDGRTGYGSMVFYRRVTDGTNEKIRDEWIHLFYYVSPGYPYATVCAWVVDSEGNEYTVDTRIGYPGWDPFE